MTGLDLALRFMLIAAAVSIITERLRVPYTVGLVIAGLVIGNMHLGPPFTVTPEVLLALLIPPLLFEGGLRLPPTHLRTHGGLIGLLAIPGTLVAAVAIGWTAHTFSHLDLKSAMLTEAGVETVRTTWDVIAFLANSVLFLLIGLEVPAALLARHWPLIAAVIVAAFVIRATVVYACASLRRDGAPLVPAAWRSVLVWAGLRGGVAIALALEVDPAMPGREAIVAAAFGVVVFTLLVQGASLRWMVRRAGLLTPSDTTAR